MKTILVWILLSMQPHPHPVSDLQFPTQADCIRAGTKLNQYGKYHQVYKCESLRIVAPYQAEGYGPNRYEKYDTPYDATQDTVRAADRAQRNGAYNQQKLDEIVRRGY